MAKAKLSTKVTVNTEEVKKAESTEQGVTAVVATDNVPEGEPKENEDGSVTAYDENNNPVGTVSAEDVKKAEESVVKVEVDQTPPTPVKKSNAPKVEVDLEAGKPDEKRKPEERVKIRLRVDHNCCIAMEFYEFKVGKVYTVPRNVKKILNKAGLLAPL